MAKKRGRPIDRWTQLNIDRPGLRLRTSHRLDGQIGALADNSLLPIDRSDFPHCPICIGGDDDLTDEHVPPEQAGGVTITRTCRRCNSAFGALVDVDLVDFFSGTFISRWWSPESGVLGRRNLGRTLLRSNHDGQFVLLMAGNDQLRRDLAQMLGAGEVSAEIQPPDLRRSRIGALKNAYLAACAQLERIPNTPSARAVRAELLSVRQRHTRRGGLPATPIADAITVGRLAQHFPALGLKLCRIAGPAGVENAILFSGRFVVAWPFPDIPPRS
jgi:hypothetical protein